MKTITARKSATGQLKEKLLNDGYVLVKEIEATGIANPPSCVNSWKRSGLKIVNYPKGSLLNGEYIEKGFYVWEDPEAPKVDAQLPFLKEIREKNEGPDNWKKLKDRITQEKFLFKSIGKQESTYYMMLVWMEQVMGEIEFDEREFYNENNKGRTKKTG